MRIVDPSELRDAVSACMPKAQQFLSDLIAIPSLPGDEREAMACASAYFTEIAQVDTIPLSDALREDPAYSFPIEGIRYEGRANLRICRPGTGTGKGLILNTHMDVVPPSQGQHDPFTPTLRNGSLYGRGACDAKGQVATMFLVFSVLDALDISLPGDLIGHIVVEEEVGGNGSLAMARHGEIAHGCIVLEPSECRILTRIRGAVWFRMHIAGTPGHSGMSGQTQSALHRALRILPILERLHAALLTESRGDPLFDCHENPMPLTIGELHAGNWPATAPGEATLGGLIGLLPNTTAQAVMARIDRAILDEDPENLGKHVSIQFPYRHDASVIPSDHDLVLAMQQSIRHMERDHHVAAMTASCDACFYSNILKIPTLVFGGGSLGKAHGNDEHMPLSELETAGMTLANTAISWSSTTI